ncbi:MAG: SSS family solute:Na+ symporter [Sphingobacteriales bacterium]|jgi:SSS family solute:Na+ symporter
MSPIDWIVLVVTLFTIVGYGIWKNRKHANLDSYLLGGKTMPWYVIGLSVMATQASAITFLSTPGQAYADGMRFVQFYFGLPIAMIILSVTFIPLYYKLKVYTAYELLESRFDLKTRILTASLFLLQRGLAAGITIYAPAIILSTILDWHLWQTNLIIGVLVILYTVSGGTKAVSQTQKQQMIVIFTGMGVAFCMLIALLKPDVSLSEAFHIAGKMDRLNAIDFSFDLNNRYTFWTGITGGLFLALSYFGTDQSQVSRYINGKSIKESRLGLLFNGLLKIPMQFFILLVGVLVFVFYQFNAAPIIFNEAATKEVKASEYVEDWNQLETEYFQIQEDKKAALTTMVEGLRSDDESIVESSKIEAQRLESEGELVRTEAKDLIKSINPKTVTKDTDYVFIGWVMNNMPVGLVGLLLAVIFSAAMSSTSSELNALASTTVIDVYKRNFKQTASDRHYVNASKLFTVGWGILAITFATLAELLDNLIQAVNILGSLFYGTILGVFLSAFYIKFIKANAVFVAALIAEGLVITLFLLDRYEVIELAYLWLNVVGCLILILFAWLIQLIINSRNT